jgi:hypothetical protein
VEQFPEVPSRCCLVKDHLDGRQPSFQSLGLIQAEIFRKRQPQYPKPNLDNLRGMSTTGSPARLGAENNGLLSEAASRSDEQSEGISEHRPWVKGLLYTRHAIKATLRCSYTNFLLVFVPLGVIAGGLGWNSAAVFILNFLAIFPLAALLSYSTEELSAHVGQIVGGLINATFGNAVEMIVSRPCIVPLYLFVADLCPFH